MNEYYNSHLIKYYYENVQLFDNRGGENNEKIDNGILISNKYVYIMFIFTFFQNINSDLFHEMPLNIMYEHMNPFTCI